MLGYEPDMVWSDILSKGFPVLTALGGYFGRFFQVESRKKRMQRHLYKEISRNYQKIVVRLHVVTSLEGLRQAATLRFTDKLDLSFSVWKFYNDEKRKEWLFELKEADAISSVYKKFEHIYGRREGYPHVRGKEAAAEVDDLLLDGSLDRKVYKKVASPEAWKYMDDLLTGRRESYRKSLNPI